MIERVGVLRVSGGARAVTIWMAGVEGREDEGLFISAQPGKTQTLATAPAVCAMRTVRTFLFTARPRRAARHGSEGSDMDPKEATWVRRKRRSLAGNWSLAAARHRVA